MKKYFLIILCLIPFIFAASIQDMQKAVIARKNASGGDVTPPEFSSSSLAVDGRTVTVNFNENVTGTESDTFTLDCVVAGDPIAMTYSSGSGTTALVFTVGDQIDWTGAGESCTLDFDGDADEFEDDSGNDLADFDTQAMTNNSLGPVTQAAVTFWWEGESTTVEYSAGDSSASAQGSATLSASADYSGTNGISVPGYDFYFFDGASIWPGTGERIGMWVNLQTADTNDPGFFRIYFGGATTKPFFQSRQQDSSNYDMGTLWDNVTAGDVNTDTSNDFMNTSTWYWCEAWYDHSDDSSGIVCYAESDLSEVGSDSGSGTFEAFSSAGNFRIGSSQAGGGSYIDHVIVVSDPDLDLRSCAKHYGYPY